MKNRIRQSRLAQAVGRWLLLDVHNGVAASAYRLGLIDSWLLHELDAALKYGRPLRKRPQ